MKSVRLSIAIPFLFCALLGQHSQAKDADDHPLISRYANSKYFDKVVQDYTQVTLPIGKIDNVEGSKKLLTAEGKATFIKYKTPEGVSILDAKNSFESAFKKANLEVLFKCHHYKRAKQEDSCGQNMNKISYSSKVFKVLQQDCGQHSKSTWLYTAQLKNQQPKKAYLYLCLREDYKAVVVNQTIVEEKEFEAGKVVVSETAYVPTKADLSGLKEQDKKEMKGAADHPLISRYAGSVITQQQEFDFIEMALPVKPLSRKVQAEETYKVSGTATVTKYETQKGVTRLQVEKNYLHALNLAGMEIVFDCYKDACGKGRYSHIYSGKFTETPINFSCGQKDSHLILAKTAKNAPKRTYLFFCIETDYQRVNIYQVALTEKSVDLSQVVLTAGELEESVKAKGKVTIYGIQFDFNSASLKPESKASLKQIAEYLIKNPKLKFYVVGHTDNKGKESYNKDLSTKRSESVVEYLTKTHGIAGDRLFARGVGDLVPVATNEQEAGRELNRRVELVQKR